MRLRSCLPCLWLVACLSDQRLELASERAEPADEVRALFHTPRSVMNIVAHQDDDLGMVGLEQNLADGGSVVTVYITAGDAGYGCQSYVMSRERGMLRAYENAARVREGAPGYAWSDELITVGTRVLRRRQTENGRITLLFVGLPNSPFFSGLSILDLWQTEGLELATVADTRRPQMDRYVREDLIELLRSLLLTFSPEHLNTLDSSRVWSADLPFDHPDHVGSALFALAAQQRTTSARPASFRQQRGYNAALEASNMSAHEVERRREIFDTYAAHDPIICSSGVTDVCAGEPAPNLQPCDDPAVLYEPLHHVSYSHLSIHGSRGTLAGPGALCLQAAAEEGSTLSLAACGPALASQQWDLLLGDQLRLRGSPLCASARFAAAERGSAITLAACDPSAAWQRFLLSTDGKLRGPDATCVEARGSVLTVRECASVPEQLTFSLQVRSPVWTATAESDGELVGLADVTGDGRVDLCERRASGLWCAKGQGTVPPSFASFVPWSSAFSDAEGWSEPAYGESLQLVDVDGDGAADVCGRAADGVYCARSNRAGCNQGSAFLEANKLSEGDSFSDRQGYASDAQRYGSVRLADISGDGAPDLCARAASGLVCALGTGGSRPRFGAPFAASGEFADASGWNQPGTGSTLSFADLDGDGAVDVCGRHTDGIRCALNDGSGHFVEAHLWSVTGEFADASGWATNEAYYGSIRLVDIDGDRQADVCARGAGGVVCGLSTGTAFAPSRPLLTSDPTGVHEGWLLPDSGASLRFADLDGDRRADLCARGPIPSGGTGLRCALGPTAP